MIGRAGSTGRAGLLVGGLVVLLAVPAVAEETRAAIRSSRYDEDWRALCRVPTLRQNIVDRVKCLSLAPDFTLGLGGELRERMETVRDANWGLGGGDDTVFLHRALVHADLRWGDSLRFFGQLGRYDETGRDGGPDGTDLDRTDLAQGFIDISLPLAGGRITLRPGRQEMPLGASRLVSVRESPNARRSFDGVRGFWEASGHAWRVEGFHLRPVDIRAGAFDDRGDRDERLWGVQVARSGTVGVQAYALVAEAPRISYAWGAGDERRESFGTRIFGAAAGWDWDIEAVVQTGRVDDRDIRAWTVASDAGYRLALPWSPRLGLKADIASGDGDPADGRVGTFRAPYPKYPYFSEANLVSPANLIDLHPSVTIAPLDGVTIGVGVDLLWRQRTADAVYAAPFAPYAGTAGTAGRYIGRQAILDLGWRATDRLTLAGQYVRFTPGDALEAAGADEGDVFTLTAQYRF